MQELAYIHTTAENTKETYTIVEYANPQQFDFMKNGDLDHWAEKRNDSWIQIDNNNVDQDTIAALGAFMDQHHQDQTPESDADRD
ncbi:hypothetical protein [Pedobacter sandarakinus]|uniref:hypothetical protein n=1 Tax=Pedobacter sandarakinus TaxID=353156 RepID=UPI002245C4AF|nr:hypothetical protein [Pedobacter sandarakinus]MCX2575085.1 hypothetical protein [Pedobacter sandarakinus]